MRTIISGKYKIAALVSQNKLQTQIRKRNDKGEYEKLDYTRTESDLAALKKAARAMTMMARGISDAEEINRKVNAMRPLRQKPPSEVRAAPLKRRAV